MDGFSALAALNHGEVVRCDDWNETTVMFVANDLLYQQATGEAYEYSLSWHEIKKTNWRIVTCAKQSQKSACMSLALA